MTISGINKDVYAHFCVRATSSVQKISLEELEEEFSLFFCSLFVEEYPFLDDKTQVRIHISGATYFGKIVLYPSQPLHSRKWGNTVASTKWCQLLYF